MASLTSKGKGRETSFADGDGDFDHRESTDGTSSFLTARILLWDRIREKLREPEVDEVEEE